jgi:regulator of protease activity HflC (stomatin/prohibitin superfamily)
VRNFTSDKLKVNDSRGNPVEIAAVVVWRVRDSAQAVFDVDDYQSYVAVQAEAAVRQLATRYPYDTSEAEETSLRGSADEVNAHLKEQLTERLELAGIDVLEARLAHLAYAPEIAGAMLQRQQAEAIIAARTRIVEGAVSMVEMALDHLKQRDVVELDEERKATMVSNLLVVLCSEHAVQPVLNAGSLYT